MRKPLTIAVIAAAVIACSFTGRTPKADWVALFDGKTLNGWHVYGHKPMGNNWKVSDGAIYFDAAGKREPGSKVSNDLVTDKSYENFHFKYDWKIAKNGNSGLIFWVQEDSAKYRQTYHTGPEMQVLDNDGHPDGKIEKHRAGNLYDLIAGKEGVVKPVGEWNTAEIICNKGKLDFILNGVTVLTTAYGDDNWKQMVAGSKFKQWPDFGTVFKGHFALQDHGNEVWFKNVMVKQL
ncbi:3-keto-disaccharide hydrolase [Sediminibacterium soli]|uniref:3-keto-disaccharide hydrolase n=1 Tax=Sediminibacterium soli TaxID=2698829 RepID=UPI00137B8FE4|nr:DUF1080 domain-containing protein [Sediminibacterium soli]NCI47783.1 DUF1080 domain-containing protein [Sediminibacterium soli]